MRYAALCALVGLTGYVEHIAVRSVAPVPRRIKVLSAQERDELEGRLRDDLENGRIRQGDWLVDVVDKYEPDLLIDHDGYSTAVYAHGAPWESLTHLYLVARKGRLVRAHVSSCLPRDPFFDGLSEEERRRWWDSYRAADNASLILQWAKPW